MLVFLLRRLLQAIIVMLVVTLLAFLLFRYVGDPVTIMLGQDATDLDRQLLRQSLGLDQSALIQFWNFLQQAVQGEFGLSLRQGQAVSTLIKDRLPATVELSVIAAVLALFIGLPLGVYTALKRNSWISQAILSFSLLGISLTTFLIGILLIIIFSVY